jgi:hypothetical protein
VQGGVRITGIQTDKAEINPGNPRRLDIDVSSAGDFSNYTLKLVSSETSDTPPDGFDPQLSSISFSFKVNCPSEFDCRETEYCINEPGQEPVINYLAKDYSSFKRLLLDRLSFTMPDWTERNPSDMQLALVELLAYRGDHLSYYQDAAATEAYLRTARKRTSLKRHARLLDYYISEGCNSRTWISVEIEEGGSMENQVLPNGTPVITHENGSAVISDSEFRELLNSDNITIFETLHKQKLHSSHNRISFYTWSNNDCCLPAGSTSASLLNSPPLFLEKGDVIIFEEIRSPESGSSSDFNPMHRHAVRLTNVYNTKDPLTNIDVLEINWHEQDALPFPLCLNATIMDNQGKSKNTEVSVARGNIVLADHGFTHRNEKLIPAQAPARGDYYPRVPRGDLTVSTDYQHHNKTKLPAARILDQNPAECLARVKMMEGDNSWDVRRDLLSSDRFSREFVVETDEKRFSNIRFGDNIMGRKPKAGFMPSVAYRTGNGTTGNVGYDVLRCLVSDAGGINTVTNPLPAKGGKDPEKMEQVREFAPMAFFTQERAVTARDYAEKTELHPEVQKALARFRWTGSWYTVYLTIDRKGGSKVDPEFRNEIIKHLERYRLAGYDLEINGPRSLPLDIELNICVKEGFFKSDVKQELLRAFSKHQWSKNQRGFFHPDNFSFGQAVFLSAVYERAIRIQGVESVEAKKFQVWGKTANKELERGLIAPSEMEIIRLDNDLNFPEFGKIEFFMFGGL